MRRVRSRHSARPGGVRSSRAPAFPSTAELRALNERIHVNAGTPNAFCLEQPGLVDHALELVVDAYWSASSHIEGVVASAALLSHGVATRQAFRDGNRRTSYLATRVLLARGGLGYVSPLTHDDHMLVRYLTGAVESQGTQYPLVQFHALLHRRSTNRRAIH